MIKKNLIKNLKIYVIFAFVFVLASARMVCAFDSIWLDAYKDAKNDAIAAISEMEYNIDGGLFYTADAVRSKVASMGQDEKIELQVVKDYINVLEGKGRYAWGCDFYVSSPEDIAKLDAYITSVPPYGITDCDDFAFLINNLERVLARYVTIIPNDTAAFKGFYMDTQSGPADEVSDRIIKLSVGALYMKKTLAHIDDLLPHIINANEKLHNMKKELSFTESDRKAFNAEIYAQKDKINAIDYASEAAPDPKSSALGILDYTKQLRLDILDAQGALAAIRYRALNNAQRALLLKDEEIADRILLRFTLEQEYMQTLQNTLALEDHTPLQQTATEEIMKLTSETIPRIIFISQQTLDEIRQLTGGITLLEKAFRYVREVFADIWTSEIWSGDGYRITLKKLLSVLVFFFFSVILCKYLSAFMQKLLFARLTQNKSAASMVRKIIFYSLLLAFTFLSLHAAGIPLISFSLFGGALAIGVGLATQNIFSNIISGFILMTAKPFKTGDLIKFEDKMLTVMEIGDRATHLLSVDGTDIFVQNRDFLESTVSNYTHYDNSKLRVEIPVNVAYDSDMEAVKKCMLDITALHEEILHTPHPFVWLTGFNDSSVGVSLYFWLNLHTSNRAQVSSNIREQILREFKEKGIIIPYPHLDVKLREGSA